MTITQLKEKFFHLLLLALFAFFFSIPIGVLFMFECKFYPPKRFASFLLFFLIDPPKILSIDWIIAKLVDKTTSEMEGGEKAVS